MTRAYSATFIGLIFTMTSFLCTWTFVIPMLTILPFGYTFEKLFSAIFVDASDSIIGTYSMYSLLMLFLFLTATFYLIFYRQARKQGRVNIKTFIIFLTLQIFVAHPLLFYVYTSRDWSRAADGQFVLGIIDTYPYSSFIFLLFGIILDTIRHFNKTSISTTINTTNSHATRD